MAGTVLALLYRLPSGLAGAGLMRQASGGVEIDFGRAGRSGQRRPRPGNAPQAFLTGGPVQPVGHPAG